MSAPYLLHLFTPLANASPFDVNMAHDAGFDAVTPYTGLTLGDIRPMTQDVIFSRSPVDAPRTGIFIGGRDAGLAIEMLEEAKGAMLPPFEVSVFADPSGAFTTAAAMVAVADRHLRAAGLTLAGSRVAVFGATGIVGSVAAVIAAQQGAAVTLVGHRPNSGLEARAAEFGTRFGVSLAVVDGSTEEGKTAAAANADLALCCAKAGVRVLERRQLEKAPGLRVVADVNAVPPLGVEGVDLMADGAPIEGSNAVGIGALAVGNIKFQVQHGLFQAMRSAEQRLYLSFPEAFAHARSLAG